MRIGNILTDIYVVVNKGKSIHGYCLYLLPTGICSFLLFGEALCRPRVTSNSFFLRSRRFASGPPFFCRHSRQSKVINSVATTDYRLSIMVCSFPNRIVERSMSMKLSSSFMKAALARLASSVLGAFPISTQACA